MLYETEWRLLCDTLRKCHVRISLSRPEEMAAAVLPEGFSPFGEERLPSTLTLGELLGQLAPCTLYKRTDALQRAYLYFKVPSGKESRIVLVGPYLKAPLSAQQLLYIGEQNGVSPKNQRYLKEYYAGIPVLPEGDRLFVLLHTFCEHVFESPAFAIADVCDPDSALASPIHDMTRGDDLDGTIVNMKAMEQRYGFENELMEAVSLGQMHKEALLLSALSMQNFEQRASDPVRNIKNYGIIMNTLLRKAAQKGGVHPMYLDSVSTAFALKIEQLPTVEAGADLMRDMFRSYCRLVRKNAMRGLSRVVQQTVLLIDSDLSADLCLGTLAKAQNVSPGYLSIIFKKEMGKTLSHYIREKRMQHAAHLLSTTQLQVQTVALHCGILDVQYFSKLFKAENGMTPREYREEAKRSREGGS